MPIGFVASLIFSLVLVGVWFVGSGIYQNNLRQLGVGAAFLLIALILGHGPAFLVR